ncbi:hypothetical protein ACFWUT_25555 [Streptomyces cyaneofuscatus]|uniref:hypothetical protein n=1 Tax=Streptomyces cyaneofuscatus TaxID=66883 RepID=UPI00365258F6
MPMIGLGALLGELALANDGAYRSPSGCSWSRRRRATTACSSCPGWSGTSSPVATSRPTLTEPPGSYCRARPRASYLQLTVCEIRDHGSSPVQICSRLRPVLEGLLEVLPERQRPQYEPR